MKLKRIGVLIALLAVILVGGYFLKKKYYNPFIRLQEVKSLVDRLDTAGQIQNGDIIFQTSLSPQSQAIQLASHSPYSHCGIIWWEAGYCLVWEAHGPVGDVDIADWIARGKGSHFVIKRLKKDAGMNGSETEMKMQKAFNEYVNKPYDIYFGWGDDKLYCSEFVWKVYKQSTGLEVGDLQKLKDFDLNNPVVAKKLKERYGNHLPLNETVISPAAIFNSELLKTVVEN